MKCISMYRMFECMYLQHHAPGNSDNKLTLAIARVPYK